MRGDITKRIRSYQTDVLLGDLWSRLYTFDSAQGDYKYIINNQAYSCWQCEIAAVYIVPISSARY